MVDYQQISQLINEYFFINGEWQINPHTQLVDVTGDVTLDTLQKPGDLKVAFGIVTGNFDCSGDPNLISLKGAPREIDGSFNCRNSGIRSLQGAPQRVGGDFNCVSTPISSLIGAPKTVGGSFFFSNTNVTDSLEGAPEKVGKMFSVMYKPQLPLLKLLNYPSVVIWRAPDAVIELLHKYQGKGRAESLAFAAELAKKGFKENARW